MPAILWNTPDGVDKLGVLAKSNGLLFVRRDDQGQLGQLRTNTLRCRKCRALKYESQYEMRPFRLFNRAYKIRRRLGMPGSSGDPLPPKPRYMRWHTYRRLELLVLRLETAGWAAMSAHANRRRMR